MDLVALPVHGDRLAVQQGAEDGDRLHQAGDPDRTLVEGQPGGVVLGLHVAGTDAQLEPAVGQQGEADGLSAHVGRMAQVVVQDQRADMRAVRVAASAAAALVETVTWSARCGRGSSAH